MMMLETSAGVGVDTKAKELAPLKLVSEERNNNEI